MKNDRGNRIVRVADLDRLGSRLHLQFLQDRELEGIVLGRDCSDGCSAVALGPIDRSEIELGRACGVAALVGEGVNLHGVGVYPYGAGQANYDPIIASGGEPGAGIANGVVSGISTSSSEFVLMRRIE